MDGVLRRDLIIGLLITLALLLTVGGHMKAQHVIYHLHNGAHRDAWHEWLMEQKERFETENPDFKIEIMKPPGSGSAEHIMTLIASGVAVDVSELTLRIGASVAAQGAYYDLRPYFERSSVLSFDDYVPVAQEALTLVSGEIWGVPVDLYHVPTHYHVDMFQERGLATPFQLDADWDYSHALEAAKRLTIDRDGDGINEEWGTHHAYSLWVYRNAFENRGVRWFDRNFQPTASRLNASDVIEALQWVADLHIVHNVTDLDSGDFSGEFPKGKYGWSMGTGPNTAQLLAGAGATFHWGVAMPIQGTKQGAYTAVNSFQIPKTSGDPDAAFRWIEFLLGSESSWESFINATNRMPADRFLMPFWLDMIDQLPNRPEGAENYVYSAIHPDNYVDILSPHYSRFEQLARPLVRQVIQGDMSPRSAMDELHRQMTSLFEGE